MNLYEPSVPEALSWESQVRQYPRQGPPGISYYAGDVSHTDPNALPVDCLLWRDEAGWLRGILNHYPQDYPPWEKAGNVNIFVDPARRRRGIGTALAVAAAERWPTWRLEQQRFTVEGTLLADSLHRVHGMS